MSWDAPLQPHLRICSSDEDLGGASGPGIDGEDAPGHGESMQRSAPVGEPAKDGIAERADVLFFLPGLRVEHYQSFIKES